MSAIRAWLELGRVSNLPTVWANVIHGLLAAYVYAVEAVQDERPTTDWMDFANWLNQLFMLLVGMSLIYLGGMLLNDVCDAKIDAVERPTRPIPSGRVSRRRAAWIAGVLLVLGFATSLVYDNPQLPWWAGGLVSCVLLYNFTHRVPGVGLLLMPACRVLLVLTAAMVFPVPSELWLTSVVYHAVAVGCYTEHWPRVVGYLIAAMPLVDAVFLYQLGMWPAAVFCVGCGLATLLGQRWIKGS